MRIIAGYLRGRTIIMDDRLPLRPTADKTRGALFSSLGDLVPDGHILDVCAGTGAVGIEAISRGASLVVAIEKSPQAAALVARNRDALNIDPNLLRIRQGSFSEVLPQLSGQQFDVIFVDPPYGDEAGLSVLELVSQHVLLKRHGKLVIEHFAKETLPTQYGRFLLQRSKKYGQTRLSYYGWVEVKDGN